MPDLGQSEMSMSRYSAELYAAWLAGFDAGWDERGDDNYPVNWILRQMYWAWRRERKAKAMMGRIKRSTSVDDYPVGTVVEWEASAHGSRFMGPVRGHIRYAGRDALDVKNGRGEAIVYPESVLRRLAADA